MKKLSIGPQDSFAQREKTNVFFKSHVGANANGRMILLATQACSHKDDCIFWEKCTNGFSRDYEDSCPFPNETEGVYNPLSMSFLFQLFLYLNDKYDEYDEYRNKTFPKLTEAIAQALNLSDPDDQMHVWENFICNEVCQHFTKQVKTSDSDFLSEDFFAFLENVRKHNIDKIIICGRPGFLFIRENATRADLNWIDANDDENSWFHKFTIDNREIIVIYSYHPSYPGFLVCDQNGKSELIMILKKFFSNNLTFENI